MSSITPKAKRSKASQNGKSASNGSNGNGNLTDTNPVYTTTELLAQFMSDTGKSLSDIVNSVKSDPKYFDKSTEVETLSDKWTLTTVSFDEAIEAIYLAQLRLTNITSNSNFPSLGNTFSSNDPETLYNLLFHLLQADTSDGSETPTGASVSSSFDVTRYVPSEFVDFYYSLFSISGDETEAEPKERASTFYNSAANIRSAVMHTYFGVQATSGDNARQIPWNNLGDKSTNNYDGVPNFEELFGEENFISVDEFESVLSPAAYLVDLEKARQENISSVDSSLTATDLNTRRPDIYETYLTIDNTTTEVPKLNLVINALEAQLNTHGSISDPQEYLSKSTTMYPLGAPFNYNHHKIFSALELLNTDMATLVKKASNPESPTAPSWQNWNISTNMYIWVLQLVSNTQAELNARFGLDSDAKLSAITPLVFQVKAGISAEDLTDVVYGDLSSTEINANQAGSLYLNQGLDADALSISYDDSSESYLFNNASIVNLDRANRMVRLANMTGLSYVQLNWLLASLYAVQGYSATATKAKRKKKAKTATISDLLTADSTYNYLAGVQAVQEQYSLSLNAAAALIGQLKYQGEANGATMVSSLFGSTVTSQTAWDSTATTGTSAEVSSSIAKALGWSAEDLQLLVSYMVSGYGQKTSSIDLTANNYAFLSGLYRAALYCQLRSISVADLIYLVSSLPNDFLALPSDLTEVWSAFQSLETFLDQLSDASISVEDFERMSTATMDTASPLLPAQHTVKSAAQELTAQMTSDVMLTLDTFTTLMMTQMSSDSADQYSELYATLQSDNYIDPNVKNVADSNLGIVLNAPVSDTDMAAIIKQLSIQSANQDQFETALNQTLLSYQEKQTAISKSVFQDAFSLNADQAATVSDWYQLYPDSSAPAAANVLYVFSKTSVITQTYYFAAMQRFASLINAYNLSQPEINFILAGNSSLQLAESYVDFAIDAAGLQNIALIQDLVSQYSDPDNLMLAALVPGGTDDEGTSISDLAKATHWDSDTITTALTNWGYTVSNGMVILKDPVTILTGLNQLFQYGQQVGLDPIWMQGFNAQFTTIENGTQSGVDNDTLATLAQQSTDAIYALNASSSSAEGINNSLIFPLTSAYRDILIATILNEYANSGDKILETIQDTNSLSEYLLTDVEVTSKFMTSKVKDAIGVFQTYFYRVIMQLESNFTINPDFVNTEWPYFRTYRLWEANREIFINPENYVRPDLKPKASSIYQNFISTIKQGKINEENIGKAFSNYLQSFTEVSGLTIVSSSCSTIVNQKCTLSFVGYSVATNNFFYRTLDCSVNNGVYTPTGWSTWKKIDAAISTNQVQLARIDDRLLILWFEVQSSDVNESPTNNSNGYVKGYEIKVNYSYLQVSGNWTNARTIMNLPVSNDESQNVYNDKTSFVQSILNQAQLSITSNAKDLVIGLNYVGYAFNSSITTTKDATYTFPNQFAGKVVQAQITLYSDFSVGNLQVQSDGGKSTFTSTYLGTNADLTIANPAKDATPVAYQMAYHYDKDGLGTALAGLSDFHSNDDSPLLVNNQQNSVYRINNGSAMLLDWGNSSYAPNYDMLSSSVHAAYPSGSASPIQMAYWFKINDFTGATNSVADGTTEKKITLSFTGQLKTVTQDKETKNVPADALFYWQFTQTSGTTTTNSLALYAQNANTPYLEVDLADFEVEKWYYVSLFGGFHHTSQSKLMRLFSAVAGELRVDNNGQCYMQELGYKDQEVGYSFTATTPILNNRMILGVNTVAPDSANSNWMNTNLQEVLGAYDNNLDLSFQNIQVNNMLSAATSPGMPIQRLPEPVIGTFDSSILQGSELTVSNLANYNKSYLVEWKGTDADKDSNSPNYLTAFSYANTKNYSPGISGFYWSDGNVPAIDGVKNPYYRLSQSGTYSPNRQRCIRVSCAGLANINETANNNLQTAFWFKVSNTNSQENVFLFYSPSYDQKSAGNVWLLNTNEKDNAVATLSFYSNYVGAGNANNKLLWQHKFTEFSENTWFYISSSIKYNNSEKSMTLLGAELGQLTSNAYGESAIKILDSLSEQQTGAAPSQMNNNYFLGLGALEDGANPYLSITGSNPNFHMVMAFTGIQISDSPNPATSPGVPNVDTVVNAFPIPFQNANNVDMAGRYISNNSDPNTTGLVTTTEMQYLTLPASTNATGGTDWRYIRLGSNLTPYLESVYHSQSFDGLFSIDTQLQTEPIFADLQPNTDETDKTFHYNTIPRSYWPVDGYLDLSSADAQYYWELFHHAPLLIAQIYQESGNYTEAQRWYQYVFNPQQTTQNISATEQKSLANDSNSERDIFWRFIGLRSFYDMLLSRELYTAPGTEFLAEGADEEVDTEAGADGSTFYNDLQNQAVQTYLNDPFDADAIAMLRPKAYQEATVMGYVQNLIAQGDALYTEQTRESIQEAYIFYTEANNLLGQKPESEGDFSDLQDNSSVNLNSIDAAYTKASQPIQEFLVGLEGNLSAIQSTAVSALSGDSPYNWIPGLYFGIPQNQQLLSLWSTLDSRFYNLRNNLDINGNPMQLALFEPPINPLVVEEGLANGLSLSAVSHLLSGTAPNYRFFTQLQRAKEFTNQVHQFGQELLSVMQQKDAEALAQLRTKQEGSILNMNLAVKQDQIDAAESSMDGLKSSIKSALLTKVYYKGLLNYTQSGIQGTSNNKLSLTDSTTEVSESFSFRETIKGSNLEVLASAADIGASEFQAIATIYHYASVVPYLLPDIFGLSDGGEEFGGAVNAVAGAYGSMAQTFQFVSGTEKTEASYHRRRDEWTYQMQQADNQLDNLAQQWNAAQARYDMAVQEYSITQKQIEQNETILNFYQDKFTNEDLYQWMKGRLTQLYYQSYKLAVQVAQQAQSAYEYEKGLTMGSLNIINSNSWNSTYEGLMAAAPLMHSLNLLEKSYMDADFRRMEITKTVSLASLLLDKYDDEYTFSEYISKQMDSSNGIYGLTFTLDEEMFDSDYPGQYCRLIKNISVSIPTLLGPYQDIHATLRQTGNVVIVEDSDEAAATAALLKAGTDLTAFSAPSGTEARRVAAPSSVIALSKGMDDTGMFTPNLQDARYLPFEGTGAVSSWNLYISDLDQNIDEDRANSLNISDIILTVRYSALVGDSAFRKNVITAWQDSNKN